MESGGGGAGDIGAGAAEELAAADFAATEPVARAASFAPPAAGGAAG